MHFTLNDWAKIFVHELKEKGFIDKKIMGKFEAEIPFFKENNDPYFSETLNEDNYFTASKLSLLLSFLKWDNLNKEEEYIYFLKVINKFYNSYDSDHSISYWKSSLGFMFNREIMTPWKFNKILEHSYCHNAIREISLTLKRKHNFYINYNVSLVLDLPEIYKDNALFDPNKSDYHDFILYHLLPKKEDKTYGNHLEKAIINQIENIKIFYYHIAHTLSYFDEPLNISFIKSISSEIGYTYFNIEQKQNIDNIMAKLAIDLESANEKRIINEKIQITEIKTEKVKRKRI